MYPSFQGHPVIGRTIIAQNPYTHLTETEIIYVEGHHRIYLSPYEFITGLTGKPETKITHTYHIEPLPLGPVRLSQELEAYDDRILERRAA